jgi:hypothetical protein
VCRAAGLADDLSSQVNAAIAAGKVPRRFQDDLRARATELVNSVNCPQAAPATTQEESGGENDNGEGNGKGKKKGHGKKQETQTEPTVTVEVPTVTEEVP